MMRQLMVFTENGALFYSSEVILKDFIKFSHGVIAPVEPKRNEVFSLSLDKRTGMISMRQLSMNG